MLPATTYGSSLSGFSCAASFRRAYAVAGAFDPDARGALDLQLTQPGRRNQRRERPREPDDQLHGEDAQTARRSERTRDLRARPARRQRTGEARASRTRTPPGRRTPRTSRTSHEPPSRRTPPAPPRPPTRPSGSDPPAAPPPRPATSAAPRPTSASNAPTRPVSTSVRSSTLCGYLGVSSLRPCARYCSWKLSAPIPMSRVCDEFVQSHPVEVVATAPQPADQPVAPGAVCAVATAALERIPRVTRAARPGCPTAIRPPASKRSRASLSPDTRRRPRPHPSCRGLFPRSLPACFFDRGARRDEQSHRQRRRRTLPWWP